MIFAMQIFSLPATIYWILVSLTPGSIPILGSDFLVTVFDDQSNHVILPVYDLVYNNSLYIVLTRPKQQNYEINLYIKTNMWANVTIINNNYTDLNIKMTLTDPQFLNNFIISTPDPKLFNSTLDLIPSKFTLPKHVKARFLHKFNRLFITKSDLIKNITFSHISTTSALVNRYLDLPPLTNG
nr:hypothetical protein [Abalone asfa-like virus]